MALSAAVANCLPGGTLLDAETGPLDASRGERVVRIHVKRASNVTSLAPPALAPLAVQCNVWIAGKIGISQAGTSAVHLDEFGEARWPAAEVLHLRLSAISSATIVVELKLLEKAYEDDDILDEESDAEQRVTAYGVAHVAIGAEGRATGLTWARAIGTAAALTATTSERRRF